MILLFFLCFTVIEQEVRSDLLQTIHENGIEFKMSKDFMSGVIINGTSYPILM